MELARQAGRQLLDAPDAADTKAQKHAVRYLRTIFELAALLHDVGHCAFSHSIETVEINGEPFLGTLAPTFTTWGEEELLAEYTKAFPTSSKKATTHEQIGLAFVSRIFKVNRVSDLCKATLQADAEDVARDVRALMNGALSPSDNLREMEATLEPLLRRRALAFDETSPQNPLDNILEVLHGLVSGTLDVDRLDYLRRDSAYCGIPYGICDADILTGNLSLGIIAGQLSLLLSDKAAFALEDMLWSRYQLFVQVLNHKTNVGLNAVLSQAIEDAIHDARLRVPQTFNDFIALTDDMVMSSVFTPCIHGKLEDKSYARALVDREVPLHLGSVSFRKGGRISTAKKNFAREKGLDERDIIAAPAKSEFIKPGSLPRIVRRDRRTGEIWAIPWDKFPKSSVPMDYRRVHFFADRS